MANKQAGQGHRHCIYSDISRFQGKLDTTMVQSPLGKLT